MPIDDQDVFAKFEPDQKEPNRIMELSLKLDQIKEDSYYVSPSISQKQEFVWGRSPKGQSQGFSSFEPFQRSISKQYASDLDPTTKQIKTEENITIEGSISVAPKASSNFKQRQDPLEEQSGLVAEIGMLSPQTWSSQKLLSQNSYAKYPIESSSFKAEALMKRRELNEELQQDTVNQIILPNQRSQKNISLRYHDTGDDTIRNSLSQRNLITTNEDLDLIKQKQNMQKSFFEKQTKISLQNGFASSSESESEAQNKEQKLDNLNNSSDFLSEESEDKGSEESQGLARCKMSRKSKLTIKTEDSQQKPVKPTTIDASSTRHASQMTQTSRKSVRKLILEEKSSHMLHVLRVFGTVSVVIVCCVTLFVYIQMIQQIDVAKVTFKYIPWPLMFRCDYSLSAAYQALLQISKRNTFPSNSRLGSTSYQALTQQRSDFGSKELSTLLLQYVHGDRDKLGFFQNFTSSQVNMVFNKDLLTISGNKLKNIPADKNNVLMSMQYLLQTSIGYIYRFSTVQNNLYEQVVRLDNVAGLISNVTSLDAAISVQCNDILNSLQSQAMLLMVVDILLIFVLVSSVFPLYIYIQRNKESVLKLFATIKQDHLDNMIRPINETLLIASNQQKIQLGPLYQQSKYTKKKKTNSSTSKLPKFNRAIALCASFFFALLIIQPIANYITINSFSSEVNDNILLVRTVYDMRAQAVSTTAQNYQYLLALMDSTYSLYNWSYYQKRIPNLVIQNSQKLSNMTVVIKQSQSRRNHYKQGIFDAFFYKIIEGNICEALRDYPEYITAENNVNYEDCLQIRNGGLKKGFTLAFDDFLTSFTQLNATLFLTNAAQRTTSLKAWQQATDLRDLDDFFTVLSQTLNSLKDFVITTLEDQLIYNTNVQTFFVGYQYVCLGLIFYFGWISFQVSAQREMHEMRKLLSIINIEVVLENPYMVNFLSH